MVPVIALIGRPNVGKSTLFNALTRTVDALVVDMPGVTRDRQYGEVYYHGHKAVVIDTGGLTNDDAGIQALMIQQTLHAVEEADTVLFMVDGRAGLTPGDRDIAQMLRQRSKPTWLVVNKTDGIDEAVACSDFHQLGFGEPLPIAASHHRGVLQLLEQVLAPFASPAPEPIPFTTSGIKVALIGRPNVGKSTLVNRLLGEDRMVVFDQPGTTRDSVDVPLERNGKRYTLIDTAGVRRKGRVDEVVEKFSVVKTLKAIEEAHIVVVLFDAHEGVTDQDLHVLGFALNAGRGLVLAINKWDGMSDEQHERVKAELMRRLQFVLDYVDVHFISALHGTGVGHLYESIDTAYAACTKQLETTDVNRVLEKALLSHSPPLVRGRRIKMRYAHVGGHNPPVIVIHGNQLERLPESYKRYLISTFREAFKLHGTPIRLELKSSTNPFAEKRNSQTPRQRSFDDRVRRLAKRKT